MSGMESLDDAPAAGREVLVEAAGDVLLLSEAYRHIGAFFWVRAGDFETALGYLAHSVALRAQLDFPGWPASGLILLGQCELAAGRVPAAVEQLRQGVELAVEAGMRTWWIQRGRDALQQAESATAG